MSYRWRVFPALVLLIVLAAVPSAAAESDSDEASCNLDNAAGSAADRAELPSAGSGKQPAKKGRKASREQQAKKKREVALQAESTSASKVVNLGDDREPEEVTLHVSVSGISPKERQAFENQLGVVAEPFSNTSETGETVTFSEPTFTKPTISGNAKRATFTMCVDAPNDLPAGKYTTTVLLEGPPSTEPAVMTVTLNAKDGHGFILAAGIAALISFLVLLYKAAGERRALLLTEAEKEDEDKREEAMEEAREWGRSIWSCICDLGWWVPTVAAVVSAFAVLYAAYAANPAWGEGGIITSAIALIGTGLAAVGAKTVFTQGTPGK